MEDNKIEIIRQKAYELINTNEDKIVEKLVNEYGITQDEAGSILLFTLIEITKLNNSELTHLERYEILEDKYKTYYYTYI